MSKIGTVNITAITSEKVNRSNEVTSKPVENSNYIIDNVRPNPITIDIVGQVTGDDAADKLEVLKGYRDNADEIEYIGRNWFRNCVIESFTDDHGPNVRNGFDFTMTLKVLRVAVAETVSIDLSKIKLPVIKTSSSNGTQATTTPTVDYNSLLASILDATGYNTDNPVLREAQNGRSQIQLE